MPDWLNKLAKTAKKATEQFVDTSKRKIQEMKLLKELSSLEKSLKKQVLERMSDKNLEDIIKNEEIRNSYIKKYKKGKIDLWEHFDREELIDLLADELNLETIFFYAKEFRVKTADLMRQYKERRKIVVAKLAKIRSQSTDSELSQELDYGKYEFSPDLLDEVLNVIKSEFTPEPPIVDERDLEKQLALFLRLKGYSFNRQYSPDGKYKVDIVFNGELGLELKIADDPRRLLELPSQIKLYKKWLNDCAALVAVPYGVDESKLNDYFELLDDEQIRYIVIRVPLQR